MMGSMISQKQQLQLELLDIRQKLRSCEQFNQVRFAWSVLHNKNESTAKNHIRLMEETLDEIHKLHAREQAIVKCLMDVYDIEGSELL